MNDAILLCNLSAGRRYLSPEGLERLCNRFCLAGIRCEPVVVGHGFEASPQLDFRNKTLLIVYGGDGTIHHAIQQAAGQSVRLAILPAGTANVLARELGIPLNLEEAIKIILQGRSRRISLGCSDDHFFHLMAGIGFDASVVASLNLRLKRVLGEGAYWCAGLKTFIHYRPQMIQVEAARELIEGTSAIIGNARNYGGNLRITPDANIADDLLDVCVFTSHRKLRYVQYFWGALCGDLRDYPDVVYRKARTIRVTGTQLPVQMDGELVGRLPAAFSIFPRGIEVVVP
ncbi:MAG TPA: diacylglycerol kinase family lipid kinase [Acidobacteriota bacterium]|nr:diacylglycerol kinase family lipid kinase [Acidobacteriota bacterium]